MTEPPEAALEGTIERFVFQADDSGFAVARLITPDQGQVTIVGDLSAISEGVPLKLTGKWVQDRKWGRQFKIDSATIVRPKTLIGIQRYLGDGLVPGVGPALAKRIVEKFGTDTLEIIEKEPLRLAEVPGIGTKKAKDIAEVIAGQNAHQDIKVFLRGIDVSDKFADRIIKAYGANTVQLVSANPYRLAHDIAGIGFQKADAIAAKIGIARDAPERLEAGLLHALETSAEDGHLHLPDDELLQRAADLLGIAKETLPPRLGALEMRRLVVRETLGDRGPCSALPWAFVAETEAAALLAELIRTPARPLPIDVHAAVHAFESVTGVALAEQQRRAVQAALIDKCVVITGGPGVGKTTIVKAIVHLSRVVHRRVSLAAPTGRAAKRLAEATGYEATTIHRLLEYNPHEGGFVRQRKNPLDADIVIVDESSMVDAQLFHALLAATPAGAQLVLVGDIDQLPSVGAGAVLQDVIASDAATVIRLTEIFRQAAQSKIVVSAHDINHGQVPDLEAPSAGAISDFYFISRDDPEAARATIVELVTGRIPQRFDLDPITDVQILAPMHRGELGTAALNNALQEALNPLAAGAVELTRGDRAFRRGDKVMQLKNDYDKGVYNGDIGVIASVDRDEAKLRISFDPGGDGRFVIYERAELDQLAHAYAVSIHKSQGSEYPAVVIPLVTQHYMMLQRSLLYTAVTRGKKLVVIVGSKRALSLAVKNAEAKRRYTWLAERVRNALAD